MTPILKVVGWFLSKCEYIYSVYKLKNINVLLGKGERFVGYPYNIRGVENIIADEPMSIGPNSTIYTTRAKLIIKSHFIAGPNLTIITGDHHLYGGVSFI